MTTFQSAKPRARTKSTRYRATSLLAALVLGVLLTATERVQAQMWGVECVYPQSDVCLDALTSRDVEKHLENAHEWLRSQGFKEPQLPGRPYYWAHLIPFQNTHCYRGACHAGPFYAFDAAGSDHNRLFVTADPKDIAHELFHAIQYSYGVFQSQDSLWWITEGTAEAIGMNFLIRNGSSPRGNIYDHRIPLNGPRSPSEAYDLHYFWRYVLGSDAGADVLLPLFAESDLASTTGVRKLDEHLTGRGGLAKMFIDFISSEEFITKYTEAYRSTDQLPLVGINLERSTHREQGIVKPIAANPYRVIAESPGGKYAMLEIDLMDDHEDLHLVVDGKLHAVETAQRKRNTFRAVIVPGQPQEFFVALVNVAKDAAGSQSRPYTLSFQLVDLNQCSEAHMTLTLNREVPFLHVLPPETFDATGMVRPGQSALSLSGLVVDGGAACAFPIGETNLQGAIATGAIGQDEAEELARAKVEEMMQQHGVDLEDLAARIQRGEVTMAQMQQMMSAVQQAQDLLTAPQNTSSTILHLFSPHLIPWQRVSLPVTFLTAHSGVAGWQRNAAAHVLIEIPGVAPSDLKMGSTYPAVAFAPHTDEDADGAGLISMGGFYSRWDGRYVPVPYPPGLDPAYRAREQRECQQAHTQWMEAVRLHESNMGFIPYEPRRIDCSYRGEAFEGESQILSGRLEGTVTITSFEGGVVVGELDLQGPGTLETVISSLVYDPIDRNRVVGNSEETSVTTGSFRVRGSFRAPATVSGWPIGPFGTTVRLDSRSPRR